MLLSPKRKGWGPKDSLYSIFLSSLSLLYGLEVMNERSDTLGFQAPTFRVHKLKKKTKCARALMLGTNERFRSVVHIDIVGLV